MKFDYKIEKISKSLAVSFVEKYHYSPIMPIHTKYFLGFYLGKELKGVLTLGWGTQPLNTIKKMFPDLGTGDYYEIGKMCMSEDMPKNSESQMISKTISWMKSNLKERLFLYTMADGIMGKVGYVYQASNFYFGEGYFTQSYMMGNGEKIHPRSVKKLLKVNRAFSKLSHVPAWLTKDFMKKENIKLIEGLMFRYVYPLSKKAKYIMTNKSTLVWDKNYPKDKDLIWFDKTQNPKIKIDKPPFTFETAEYNPQSKKISKTPNFPLDIFS